MKEIITIEQRDGQSAVSATELYGFLHIQTPFAKWIQRRIREYGFVQNVDYQRLDKFVQTPNGGQKEALEDYILTLDMAKELAMVEKNDKGRQARRYFIEVEKQARRLAPPTPDQMAVPLPIRRPELPEAALLREMAAQDHALYLNALRKVHPEAFGYVKAPCEFAAAAYRLCEWYGIPIELAPHRDHSRHHAHRYPAIVVRAVRAVSAFKGSLFPTEVEPEI